MSIFRDFGLGGYATTLSATLADAMTKGITRILDFHRRDQEIKYVDHKAYQIIRITKKPFYAVVPRIIVLTDDAIYVMEMLSSQAKVSISRQASKLIPNLVLRRRLLLKAKDAKSVGVLESFNLSKLSDSFVGLSTVPVRRIADPKAVPREGWTDKKQVKKCEVSGRPFGFFDSKKRCRVTGNVQFKETCDTMCPVPDNGFYEPSRVQDGHYGLLSLDQAEDLLLISYRKTELLCCLLKEWKNLYNNQSCLKFIPDGCFLLRVGPDPKTSKVPCSKVQLIVDKTVADNDSVPKATPKLNADMTSLESLAFAIAEGIPDDVIDGIKQKRMQRIAEEAMHRKRKDYERAQHNKDRDRQYEQARVLRQQEKKAGIATRKVENKVSLPLFLQQLPHSYMFVLTLFIPYYSDCIQGLDYHSRRRAPLSLKCLSTSHLVQQW